MLPNVGIHFPSHGSKQETYELRYVFGYVMDGADLPCYILVQTEDHSFWCLDAWKGDWVQLDKYGFIAPVGIEHFFDASALAPRPGEQQQVKLWVFLLAILRRILVSSSGRKTNSRSLQGVHQRNICF